MKRFTAFLLLLFSIPLYSIDSGLDSGREPIELYENNGSGDTAILIIGGIHGDEAGSVDAVNYIKSNLNTEIKCYYIPDINPTIGKVSRRGYLRNQLTDDGYLLPDSNPEEFSKREFYQVFYGSEGIYSKWIHRYIDPNRDFEEQLLPSTRYLIKLIDGLKMEFSRVIILSFHGYMRGGRIYPEYRIVNGEIKINNNTWKLAKSFERGSSFLAEKLYGPSVSLISRFSGELVAYTGRLDGVEAMDIELNSYEQDLNPVRSLKGVETLLNNLK